MIKKFVILFCFYLLAANSIAAKKDFLFLNIFLDGKPQHYLLKTPLHFETKAKIDLTQKQGMIVDQLSEVTDKGTTIVALAVTPKDPTAEDMTLQFQLLQYSLDRGNTILAQSKLPLRNGQMGELFFDKIKLRVTADWG